eukprot:318395-Pelagomonas_calceolata.AAC.7
MAQSHLFLVLPTAGEWQQPTFPVALLRRLTTACASCPKGFQKQLQCYLHGFFCARHCAGASTSFVAVKSWKLLLALPSRAVENPNANPKPNGVEIPNLTKQILGQAPINLRVPFDLCFPSEALSLVAMSAVSLSFLQDATGMTALHAAARAGNDPAVLQLLESKAMTAINTMPQFARNDLPLPSDPSSFGNDLHDCKFVNKYQRACNGPLCLWNALTAHRCLLVTHGCYNCYVNNVAVGAALQANPNIAAHDGSTALMAACENGHTASCKVLLSCEAHIGAFNVVRRKWP